MMHSAASRKALPWPLVLAAALMLGYLFLPFVTLVGALPAADRSAFAGEGTVDALRVTLIAAAIATAVDAVLGLPLGFWLARTRSRFRHVVTAAVLLPLAVPPVVGGLLLILWLGPNGWLGSQLERLGIEPINTLFGTILAQMFVAAPFVVISARAAFGALDPSLEETARSLGCGPGQTLIRVLAPAARRGIATGLVLGFVRCLGEFGATAVVAYHPYTLPVLTYVRLSEEGLSTALPAGAVLALIGALAAGTMLWLDARRPRRRPAEDSIGVGHLGAAVNWIQPRDVPEGQAARVRAVLTLDGFHLDVSFDAPLEIVAILGPSGAGKTVTLRSIAGFITPLLGRVELAGRLLLDTAAGVDLPPERRHLGYVGQREALFEHLDVEGNIGFALHRLPSASRQVRIAELLEAMGLVRVRNARPSSLSGGERQRVALGRALAAQPLALLLDEPFSAVDVAVRQGLRSLLREVHDRTGLPILIVTHDREDVLDLADHVIVLDRGQVVQAGPSEEVFTRPANRRVAALVGIPNVLTVRSLQPWQHGQVRALTDWGELTLPAPERSGSAWELAVPTDAVQVTAGGRSARILGVRPATGGWRIWIRLEPEGEPLEALVPRSDFSGRPFAGLACDVAINADGCHLIPAGSGEPAAATASTSRTASRKA